MRTQQGKQFKTKVQNTSVFSKNQVDKWFAECCRMYVRRHTCVYVCVCTRDLRGRLIEVRGVRHVGQALAELAAELTCLSLLIAALLSPALHSPELNAFCSSLIKSL